MFDTAFQNEPMFQFSVKLCAAIKKYECLYDQKAFSFKNMSTECEAAWKVVANECDESVENCTWRWKNMRKSFLRALRRGNKKYYLHEYMEYMIPYLLGSEPEPDDKTSEETNLDIKLPIPDDSAPQDEENEDTTTDIKLTTTDITSIENKKNENTKPKENNNKDEQKKDGFDSDTTSADESHIAISQKASDNFTDTNQVGEFIIKEIDESASNTNGGDGQQMKVQLNEGEVSDNGTNSKDVTLNNEDDASRRSRYKRACKRGLDAEILSELTTEKQDEKRPRRSAERRKTLASIALEEFIKRKSLPNLSTKKSEPKVPKTKSSKNTSLKVDDLEQQPINMEATVDLGTPVNKDTPVYQHTAENIYTAVNQVTSATPNIKTAPIILANTDNARNMPTVVPPMPVNNLETPENIFYQQTINQTTMSKKPLMIDNSTITDFKTRNSSCQYEVQQDALDFDDTFINSLKPQLKLMNSRQKFNFKRKVFQSLMEVFDDASNFPNTNEYIVLPSTGAPRFDTTTNEELRLMRELVSLVQSAKTTPEIINATERELTTVNPVLEKPSTPQMSQAALQQSSSPILISPSLDDEDFRFTTEPVNEDDTPLPQSLDEILARRDDDDVLGLPRRVIHKVVKVSGPNGSTIVTGEGGKRRVYRIYPKTVNVVDSNSGVQPKNGGGTGTFYVNPSKGTVTSQQFNQRKVNMPNSTNPTITFRALQKTPNNSLNSPTTLNNSYNTPTSSNSQNKTQPIIVATYKTPISSANTSTQILDQATGLFIPPNVSTSKTVTSTTNNNRPINSTLLPPNSGNSNPNNAPQRVIVRTQGGITRKLVPAHSALMQRRYSICGPAPTRSSPIPVVTRPISKLTVSTNGDTIKSGTSQIQISKPISLNTNAGNLQTSHQNPRPVIHNTTRANIFSNNASSSTKIYNTTPSVVNINNRPLQQSSSNPSQPSSITSNKRSLEQSSSNPSPSSSITSNKRSLEQSSSNSSPPINQEKRTSNTPQQPLEIPVLETAGTIAADTFADPLFVKPLIKNEPLE